MSDTPDKKLVDNQPIAPTQSVGGSVGLAQKERGPSLVQNAGSEGLKSTETALGKEVLERPVEISPQAATPTKTQTEGVSVTREHLPMRDKSSKTVQALKELGAELDAKGASNSNPSFQISWLREEVKKLLKRFKIF